MLSADGYKHINVINRDTNQRVPITSGKMVATKLYHWDEKAHLIYFKVGSWFATMWQRPKSRVWQILQPKRYSWLRP